MDVGASEHQASPEAGFSDDPHQTVQDTERFRAILVRCRGEGQFLGQPDHDRMILRPGLVPEQQFESRFGPSGERQQAGLLPRIVGPVGQRDQRRLESETQHATLERGDQQGAAAEQIECAAQWFLFRSGARQFQPDPGGGLLEAADEDRTVAGQEHVAVGDQPATAPAAARGVAGNVAAPEAHAVLHVDDRQLVRTADDEVVAVPSDQQIEAVAVRVTGSRDHARQHPGDAAVFDTQGQEDVAVARCVDHEIVGDDRRGRSEARQRTRIEHDARERVAAVRPRAGSGARQTVGVRALVPPGPGEGTRVGVQRGGDTRVRHHVHGAAGHGHRRGRRPHVLRATIVERGAPAQCPGRRVEGGDFELAAVQDRGDQQRTVDGRCREEGQVLRVRDLCAVPDRLQAIALSRPGHEACGQERVVAVLGGEQDRVQMVRRGDDPPGDVIEDRYANPGLSGLRRRGAGEADAARVESPGHRVDRERPLVVEQPDPVLERGDPGSGDLVAERQQEAAPATRAADLDHDALLCAGLCRAVGALIGEALFPKRDEATLAAAPGRGVEAWVAGDDRLRAEGPEHTGLPQVVEALHLAGDPHRATEPLGHAGQGLGRLLVETAELECGRDPDLEEGLVDLRPFAHIERHAVGEVAERAQRGGRIAPVEQQVTGEQQGGRTGGRDEVAPRDRAEFGDRTGVERELERLLGRTAIPRLVERTPLGRQLGQPLVAEPVDRSEQAPVGTEHRSARVGAGTGGRFRGRCLVLATPSPDRSRAGRSLAGSCAPRARPAGPRSRPRAANARRVPRHGAGSGRRSGSVASLGFGPNAASGSAAGFADGTRTRTPRWDAASSPAKAIVTSSAARPAARDG